MFVPLSLAAELHFQNVHFLGSGHIIQSNGLKLDEAQKNKFIEIYKRERRKLEEELRAEMNQHRQKRLPALQKSVVEAYQKEIAVTTASPTP